MNSRRVLGLILLGSVLVACGGGGGSDLDGGGSAPVTATALFDNEAEAKAIVQEVVVADAAPEILIFDVFSEFNDFDGSTVTCASGGNFEVVPGVPSTVTFNNCVDLSDGALPTLEGTFNGQIAFEFSGTAPDAEISLTFSNFSWDSPAGLFEIGGAVAWMYDENGAMVSETYTADRLIFSNDNFVSSIPDLMFAYEYLANNTTQLNISGAIEDLSPANPVFEGMAVFETISNLVLQNATQEVSGGEFVVYGADNSSIRVSDSSVIGQATVEISYADGSGIPAETVVWLWSDLR